MTGPVFDAYHAWLGIPAKDHPLNHYRLLGLELFESNLDVIEAAADRQMGFVRQYQSGEHAADAARILNELAIARLRLLRAAPKATYDARLRQQLAPPKSEFSPEPDVIDYGRLAKNGKSKNSTSRASSSNRLLIISGSIAAVIAVLAVILFTSPAKPISVAAGKTESTKTNRDSSDADKASAKESPKARPAVDSKTDIAADDSDGLRSKPADSNPETVVSQSPLAQRSETDDVPLAAMETDAAEAVPQEAQPEPPRERVAIPSNERQKSIRVQLDDSLGLAKATNTLKKSQALKDLMKIADDPATSGDELYVVIQAALPLIREKSDLAALRTTVQKLTDKFQLDPINEQAKQLEEFIAACKSSPTLDQAVKDVVALVELANGENRFADAKRSLDFAELAAKKLNAKNSITLLAESRKLVDERDKAFADQKKGLQTLKMSPDDPQANFLVGNTMAVF